MTAILPRAIADFAARAGSMPVYMSGNFFIHHATVAAICDWLRGLRPGVELVHARKAVAVAGGLYQWSKRWPAERTRYGAMLLLTMRQPDRSPHFGKHVLEEPPALEVAAFAAMHRPIGWLALTAGFDLRFHSRFAVESFERVDAGCFAVVSAAVDAEPFVPVVSLPVIACPSVASRPHLAVVE